MPHKSCKLQTQLGSSHQEIGPKPKMLQTQPQNDIVKIFWLFQAKHYETVWGCSQNTQARVTKIEK